MTNNLINCENICVVRNGKHILQEVSLSIEKGDFITIIGPNGAGKSMLLKTIIGIESFEAGSVTKKDGLKIGYVPQRIFIDASMPITAFDFLKMVKGSTKQAIIKALNDTGAGNILHKQMHEISGGEMQRVLVARAILQQPDIIILDEPAQNLDVSGQLSFYQLLKTLHKESGIAILMVSHDLHMVMASTNKVICLYHHICCTGTPDKITKEPEFIKLFGKDFSDMMAVYNHHHNHEHTHDNCDGEHEHHHHH
jgi:zinc transport system ATP-binding protein